MVDECRGTGRKPQTLLWNKRGICAVCGASVALTLKHHLIRAHKRPLTRHITRAVSTDREFAVTDWKPIETAPTDGTPINVWLDENTTDEEMRAFYCVGKTFFSAGWSFCQGRFRPLGGVTRAVIPCTVTPSHWQPVPKGPYDKA